MRDNSFEGQKSRVAIDMALMVYDKYASESYFIRSCDTDYNVDSMELKKLKYDFASYGISCDKLVSCTRTYSSNRYTCVPRCKPCETDDTVDTCKICNDMWIQDTPSTVWNVVHILDFRPNVTTVMTVGGEEVEIKGVVEYDPNDVTKLTITFSQAVAGKAYLS